MRVTPLGELAFARELIVVMRCIYHWAPLHRLITRFLQAAGRLFEKCWLS